MNIRQALYFAYHDVTGTTLRRRYQQYVREDHARSGHRATQPLLRQLLAHCHHAVPYYTRLFDGLGTGYETQPERFLQQLPVLTKALIRQNFDQLQSRDSAQRNVFTNTSGGSTGEPIKLMQDQSHWAQSVGMQLLGHQWAGREFGSAAMWLWGSEADILHGSESRKMRLANRLANNRFINAYRLDQTTMRAGIAELNAWQPQLIVAYAQAIYELACFAEKHGIAIRPQRAIMSCAGTLYPFMRAKLEAVFGCPVFNQYGSREVGNIACECAFHDGLHVFPWGGYVEILDDTGQPVPDGSEGEIVITCLTNYAMPLVRYAIGDRGVLAPEQTCRCGRRGQRLANILGRTSDMFKTQSGTVVDAGFFSYQLYFREWITKYQVVQTTPLNIAFNIVKSDRAVPPADLQEITANTRVVMGSDCQIDFAFVDEIQPSASGKYRYTISEV